MDGERETSMCCSTYWCIHCLVFICALTRDRTHDLDVLGRCSDQLNYLARAGRFYFYIYWNQLLFQFFLALSQNNTLWHGVPPSGLCSNVNSSGTHALLPLFKTDTYFLYLIQDHQSPFSFIGRCVYLHSCMLHQKQIQPWLVWLSGWSASLWAERSGVQFLIRA